jgi:hypothetical protein
LTRWFWPVFEGFNFGVWRWGGSGRALPRAIPTLLRKKRASRMGHPGFGEKGGTIHGFLFDCGGGMR